MSALGPDVTRALKNLYKGQVDGGIEVEATACTTRSHRERWLATAHTLDRSFIRQVNQGRARMDTAADTLAHAPFCAESFTPPEVFSGFSAYQYFPGVPRIVAGQELELLTDRRAIQHIQERLDRGQGGVLAMQDQIVPLRR